ncbi:MAG TPA: protein adenylyltransferase SelO family protein, partial [Candidatus Elarobacter sp.]
SSLIERDALDAALARYEHAYRTTLLALLRAKLGVLDARDDDAELAVELFGLLEARRVDWTNFWRALSHADADALALIGVDASSTAWFERYARRVTDDRRSDTARRAAMRAVNPKYVLRNWVAQEAIAACESGDDSVVQAVLDVLRAPFDEHPERAAWTQAAPAQYAGLSVSCSS